MVLRAYVMLWNSEASNLGISIQGDHWSDGHVGKDYSTCLNKGETTKDGTMIREIQFIPSIYTDQDSCSLDSLYKIRNTRVAPSSVTSTC